MCIPYNFVFTRKISKELIKVSFEAEVMCMCLNMYGIYVNVCMYNLWCIQMLIVIPLV